MSDIVKVQKPLSTNERVPSALIYDANKSRQMFTPMHTLPPAIRAALDEHPKVYVRGHWSALTGWTLGRIVGDQPW